jgi:hypothetical protein
MRALHAPFVYRPGELPNSHLYEVVEDKDIVMPSLSDFGAKVVTSRKKTPEYVEVTLKLRMPVDVLPTNDVGWVFDATDVLVVMAFNHGTVKWDAVPEDSGEVFR